LKVHKVYKVGRNAKNTKSIPRKVLSEDPRTLLGIKTKHHLRVRKLNTGSRFSTG
jgi:hypothetical protein